MIVSFKQNLRVINRTNNKTWQWVEQKNGKYKKELVNQKGKNFAVRKSLHQETVSGKVQIREIKTVSFNNAVIEKLVKKDLSDKYVLVDKKLGEKIKKLISEGLKNKEVFNYFKERKYKFDDKNIEPAPKNHFSSTLLERRKKYFINKLHFIFSEQI